jgi:uncharacterized protein
VETPIGKSLARDGWRLPFVTAASAVIVGADLAIIAARQFVTDWRYGLTAAIIVGFGSVAWRTGDAGSFGFRLVPLQSWTYWAKATVLIGAVLALCLMAVAGVVFGLLRYPVAPPSLSGETQIPMLFVWMCIISPLCEEILYRLAICAPLAARWGPTAAIVVSGTVFAGLHLLYGNPSPENLLGGFFLAWAFLKSGTLVVPIALHALGNLFAALFQVGYFYFRT